MALIGSRFFGLGVLGLLALQAVPASAQAPSLAPSGAPAAATAPQTRPAQIDRNGVLILIRSVLLAVHQANETGNYTVLRELGSPGFQAANTSARLSEIFSNLRSQKIDLSGVTVLEPRLTVLPEITPNGQMRMAGFFPSVPLQVNFELIFAPVEGRWRPFGIGINVGQSGPVAPAPPPPEPPQAQDKPAPAAKPEPAKPAPEPARPRRPAVPPASE
ncbi:hypothetical protein [Microvirga pudoricolor]|uniref:hypothetical protein n=1 Tax=Microvirga pudoricolor TaxID=2778729 RepID=UPI001951C852|nr:hypothetical protein [Microvirga pudoricolor]MBM6594169.1 hypothetical protein [Microvirga pudoricolor]